MRGHALIMSDRNYIGVTRFVPSIETVSKVGRMTTVVGIDHSIVSKDGSGVDDNHTAEWESIAERGCFSPP